MGYQHGKKDWSLNRTRCEQGDLVIITITNLSHLEEQSLEYGTLLEVKDLKGATVHRHALSTPIIIKPEDNYTCIWDTSSIAPGVYEVFPVDWGKALRRKVIVMQRRTLSAAESQSPGPA